jgi:O-6-methylguanine DNA methyltransferase
MRKIVYKEFESPVGRMVAAATETGCCLLEFEDRGGLETIKKRILKRYGVEMAQGEGPLLERVLSETKEYFEGARFCFSFPLDAKGTVFQRSVWRELLSIPYGETRTYGEIAVLVGRPKAVRAVGRANGENYIGIAVPCHRVIERGGGLRGYGGGLWRKKHLLEHEKRLSAKTAIICSRAGGDNPPERLPAKGLNMSLDLFEDQAKPAKEA